MRICVLSDETLEDFDPEPFLAGYDWEMHTLVAPIADKISALAESGEFDVFLNLCEGYEDDEIEPGKPGYRGIEVVRALEEQGVVFTGAESRCYDPDREYQQAVAEAHGIRFARGFRVQSAEEAAELAQRLPYPIIVKHPQSYGSTGMLKESRADSLDQLREQVARICGRFGAARIEEFVVGNEYNVLVVDNAEDLSRPLLYPPEKLVFPQGEEFWYEDLKWAYDAPVFFERVADTELAARLQDAGRRMFLALGMAGYGRCDIRESQNGELVMLEMNPNAGIMFPLEEYGPADWIILFDEDGYRGFFDRVFAAAFARHALRRAEAPGGPGSAGSSGGVVRGSPSP